MKSIIKEWNAQSLESDSFKPFYGENQYGKFGKCWELSKEFGSGFFWIYRKDNLFDIKIHDFYFHNDTLIECGVNGYLSIFYYDSISGEQLTPYRRMNAGCIQSLAGNHEPYTILVHKQIPIRCIGIGITPDYYKGYLKEHYPAEYLNPYFAFEKLNQEENFPELIFLLKQVQNYRGAGIAAQMFYESKVSEVVSLLIERTKNQSKKNRSSSVTKQDLVQIETAAAYINDHYACDIPFDRLTQIACMSATKFRTVFKKVYSCTVMEYIQQRRLSHAECLLSKTDLTIGQIAKSVGYSTSSRLSELFRQSTGLTPANYRKLTRNN